MDSCSSSKKFISRKNTFKRDSSNNLVEDFETRYYSRSDLKMLMLFCLISQFEEQKSKILTMDQKNAQQKLHKTGTHFNRTSSTLTIQPIKKQTIQLKSASLALKQLSESIITNLLLNTKKSAILRKSTISSFNQSSLLVSPEYNTMANSYALNTPNEIKSSMLCDCNQKIKGKVLTFDQGKQNRIGHFGKQNLDVVEKGMMGGDVVNRKQSVKNQMDSLRRQRFFMLRKKQQLNFLNKITVNFSSQQAQFKALVQTMQIFLKNLTRSNYFLKTIDHNIKKCFKILIYIQQLLKVFTSIVNIYTQLSTQHKVLNLKQNENIQKSEISYLHPLIDQYYEKSNQTIKIMRHFSVSPIFADFMIPQKEKCSELIALFVEARYLLRYMEKEIQNLEIRKKQGKNLPKWQQAFRVKFLPKNTMY